MEEEHLHLLINEEIYLLPQDELVDARSEESMPQEETLGSEATSDAVKEPEPKLEESGKEAEDPVAEPEEVLETPEIPIQEVEEPEELPFAVFHNSTDESEIDLLHKIIDACKLPEGEYKIFGNGFDQSVQFKKALVFVPEAKAFYTPIPYKGSQFLCSRPLSNLARDQNEKAKLWGALQKFV